MQGVVDHDSSFERLAELISRQLIGSAVSCCPGLRSSQPPRSSGLTQCRGLPLACCRKTRSLRSPDEKERAIEWLAGMSEKALARLELILEAAVSSNAQRSDSAAG